MKTICSAIAIFMLFFIPETAYAHAFGQLYTLPIPLWLYLWGAAAALTISFVLIGFFATESRPLNLPKFHLKIPSGAILISKIFALMLFLITIFSGFFGAQTPTQNFATNFFWIIFLLGLTYLSAMAGNIWQSVNPFSFLLSPLQLKPLFKYPKKLGYLPALGFYLGLLWLELLSNNLATNPPTLSTILLTYSIITVIGAIIFGLKDWLKYAEVFSVFFNLISRLSPFTEDDLVKQSAEHISLLFFILLMLSSTAFDGFRSTTIYFRYFYLLNPAILLILSWLLFFTLYFSTAFLMKKITQTSQPVLDLSLKFAFSLIPIVLAYNVAHYFTLLLIQGQQIIPLISDPFNRSWNLFGSVDYQINVGLLKAKFVWNFEVSVIILGHIGAVLLAHLTALKIFPPKKVLISQLPMLILMVFYTVVGLWILSQPLTVGG